MKCEFKLPPQILGLEDFKTVQVNYVHIINYDASVVSTHFRFHPGVFSVILIIKYRNKKNDQKASSLNQAQKCELLNDALSKPPCH